MTRNLPPVARLLRFGAVGAANTLVSYLVFALLLRLGAHFAVATLAGGICGVALGFKLHGNFVFNHTGHGRFPHFLVIFMLCYALSLGIQAIARLVMDGFLAGALATAFVVPFSFLLNRNLVFRD